MGNLQRAKENQEPKGKDVVGYGPDEHDNYIERLGPAPVVGIASHSPTRFPKAHEKIVV